MSTLVLSAASTSPQQIGSWLRRGATVVVPTETVYRLAVVPTSALALKRVFELKGRPPELNLPVVIGEAAQLSALGVDFNRVAQDLASRFWPGPLTIVMGFGTAPRPTWLDGREEVAVRFPAFDLLRAVARESGPLLVTSANAHGTGPKRTVDEALASLQGEADFAVDSGTLLSTPTTILNVRYKPATVERLGAVTADDLRDFIRKGLVIPENRWQT